MIDAMIGRMVGPYRLDERLGGGGMASVYRGVHQHLHIARAVKIMSPALAAHASFVRLFHREAQLAISLDHPNIVKVYDVGVDGPINYLVMELLEGRSLRHVVQGDRPLGLLRAAHFIRQLADALDHAHSRGVVHRDVKPANAFVGADDRLTLVDFGIARAADGTHLTMTHGIGTPEYMAPEIFDDELADRGLDPHDLAVGADLYALGVVAYELLSGRLPFSGRNAQAVAFAHVHRPPPPLRLHAPGLSAEIEQIVLRQVAKRPSERLVPAGAFADALTRAVGTAVERGELGEAITRGDLDRAERLIAGLVAAGASNALVAGARQRLEARRSDLTSLEGVSFVDPVAVEREPTDVAVPTLNGRHDIPPPPVAEPPPPGAPPTEPRASTAIPSSARRRWPLVAALAVVVVLLGAYQLGMFGALLPSQQAGPLGQAAPTPAATAIEASAPATTVALAATPPSTAPAPTATPLSPTAPPATPTAALPPTPSPADRLQAAQAAAFAGDFPRAVTLLDALAADGPDTPGLEASRFKIHVDHAALLRDRGEVDASLAQYDAALKLRPGDPTASAGHRDALLLKYWTDMEKSWTTNEDAALEALGKIMELQPEYRETRQKLYALLVTRADRYLGAGDRDGAFPILMRALEVNAEGAEARLRLASYTPTPTPLPPTPIPPTRPPAPPPPQVQPQPQSKPVTQPAPPPPPPPPAAPAPTATKVPFKPPGG